MTDPRTVTMEHGAVHVLLPDDCPCNPIIRVPSKDEQDWRLGPGEHHVRVHSAIGNDIQLMEMVD